MGELPYKSTLMGNTRHDQVTSTLPLWDGAPCGATWRLSLSHSLFSFVPYVIFTFPGFKASRYTYDRETILHIGEACYGVDSDQLQLLAFPELQPKARRNMGHTTRRGNVAGGEVPSGEWGA